MATEAGSLRRRIWVQSAISLPILAAILFVPAGTLHFWQGWLYGFVFVGASIALTLYFIKRDPQLIERRMRGGPTAEQLPAQKIIMSMTLLGFLLLIVLPGLDYRFHWSAVPAWLVFAANAGVALSFLVFVIVLKENSFAASTIRVEPGQPVISSGPYAYVRHPLYSGALLLLVFTPLALGSCWTLLVLIPMVPVLAWRLIDEERFLARNLPGYADYCQRVRFRLIPGVW